MAMKAVDASYVAGFLEVTEVFTVSFTKVQPYVVSKQEYVGCALAPLSGLDRVQDPELVLQLTREVDAFATLNYSKTKRITAVDVERHLRSMGALCPRNDFLESRNEEMASLG